MEVKFLDVKESFLELQNEINTAFSRVMNSGSYILGEEVALFEAEFAKYCDAKHCIGVGNGLDALTLLLKVYGITNGDEVIVPANTYIATWLAISNCGATPVPIDPCPLTYNIDPLKIRSAITNKTKAILAVHLYGQSADMDALKVISDEYGLLLFEDAAQAHGARYKGRRVGSLGDGAGFSFYPGKNLGAFADGGAITTNNDLIANKLRLLRNYGSKIKYHHELQGFNSRLDELQAAFLRIKLTKLDKWNDIRKNIAKKYISELRGQSFQLPYVPDRSDPVWHLFVVQTEEREALQKYLLKHNIQTLIHYPIAPHLQPAYSDMAKYVNLPISESIHARILSLPIGPHLSSESAEYVIHTLLQYQGNKNILMTG